MKTQITEEDIQLALKDIIAGNLADILDNEQISKYHTGYKGRTGHGFAAEDVNARIEELFGKHVSKIGTDNAKNGADRLTNGKPIQSKYYSSAHTTLNSAFDKTTGLYKYKVRNGRPMALEVPRDQYDKVVKLMEQKIIEKKVPCVRDPKHAKKLVKKGFLTYNQSLDAARSGNLTSIAYDAVSGCVQGTYSFGISGAIKFVALRKQGVPVKDALKEACKTGSWAFLSTTATHVVASQTEKFIADVAAQGFKETVKNMHLLPKATKAAADGAKAVSAASPAIVATAENQASKSTVQRVASSVMKSGAKTNVITGAVTTAVTAIPDVVKAAKGKITWREAGENTAVNGVSVATGMTGATYGAAGGAKLGAVIGGFVAGPPGAAVGATVGTVVGGFTGSVSAGITGAKAAQSAREWIDQKIDGKKKKNKKKI